MSGYTNFAGNIEQLISKELTGLGFELIGVELEGHKNSKVIRIFADRATHKQSQLSADKVTSSNHSLNPTGITVGDCGKINSYLNRIFSVLPEFQITNYSLEVSSPGVERRIFNLLQAQQYIGKEIQVKLKYPLNNKSKLVGMLHSVNHASNKLTIDIDGQGLEFDFSNVVKANLVYRKFN